MELIHYLGYGVKLPYTKEYSDKAEELIEQSNSNLDSDKVGDINIVVDGMCGKYIYVIKLLQVTSIEDMACMNSSRAIDLSECSRVAAAEIRSIALKIVGNYNTYEMTCYSQIHSFYHAT